MKENRTVIAAAIALLAMAPENAFAYVGPGAGLSLVGAFFMLAAVFILSILMALLWPLRMLLKKMFGIGADSEEEEDETSEQASDEASQPQEQVAEASQAAMEATQSPADTEGKENQGA